MSKNNALNVNPMLSTAYQRITTPGVFSYTPTSTSVIEAIFDMVGPGGGSAGCVGGASTGSVASGGGGGGYLRISVKGAANLAAITGVLGTAGAAGASGLNNGGAATDTTLTINGGTTWHATGGAGGGTQNASPTPTKNGGAIGGVNVIGTNAALLLDIPGGDAEIGFINNAASQVAAFGSNGGTSFLSNTVVPTALGQVAAAGKKYGGGAAGPVNGTGGNLAGATGGDAIIVITEILGVN